MLKSTDYELKLLVDPDRTLDAGGEPTADMRTAFAIDEHKTIVMQFLDSARRDLDDAQWNVRFRAFDDEDDLELTYKKRYPITNDDIDAALAHAAVDGFNADTDEYEAQVEWGMSRKTLSISKKAKPDSDGSDPLDLPGERKSRELCAESIPARLEQQVSQGWLHDVLDVAHLYGPVRGKRWKGSWKGSVGGKKKVSIEVWPIRGKPGQKGQRVVEVSVKEDDRATAQTIQAELRAFLAEKGWLLDREILKTQLILKRY